MEKLTRVTDNLNNMIGMQSVKSEMADLISIARNQRERAELGLPVEESSMHLVFDGNPGTGKTTAARALGEAYHALGLLEKPTVKTVSRADLVAGYTGQSAGKTREAFNKAKGGVLFIDEAYDLVRGSKDDYGQEALAELIQQAENNRDNTVVILAGYPKETSRMLSQNPGAKSRFPTHVSFPDYSPDEKLQIAEKMFANKQYTLDAAAKKELKAAMAKLPTGQGAGNARDVRTLYERTFKAQARRLAGKGASKEQHKQITAEDVRAAAGG